MGEMGQSELKKHLKAFMELSRKTSEHFMVHYTKEKVTIKEFKQMKPYLYFISNNYEAIELGNEELTRKFEYCVGVLLCKTLDCFGHNYGINKYTFKKETNVMSKEKLEDAMWGCLEDEYEYEGKYMLLTEIVMDSLLKWLDIVYKDEVPFSRILKTTEEVSLGKRLILNFERMIVTKKKIKVEKKYIKVEHEQNKLMETVENEGDTFKVVIKSSHNRPNLKMRISGYDKIYVGDRIREVEIFKSNHKSQYSELLKMKTKDDFIMHYTIMARTTTGFVRLDVEILSDKRNIIELEVI